MCGIERDDSYLSPHSNIHLLQPLSQVQLRQCCNSQGTPHRIWKSRSLSSRSSFRSLISGLEPPGNRCPAPSFLSFRMLQAVIRGELGPGSLELFFERLGSSYPRYLRPNSSHAGNLLTGIAPGGFESSGTTIPEGRALDRTQSLRIFQAIATLLGLSPGRVLKHSLVAGNVNLRSSNSRSGIARRNSRTPLPGNLPPYFLAT